MDKKISVIIPVYNSEKYLDRCIESLISQTMKEIEFIFIDDGSSDNSKFIIKKYKELDERIILIEKENGGVSSARNLGIINAKGEYLAFVDSDDWIDLNMYEELYNIATINKCECVMCSIVEEKEYKEFEKIDIKKNSVIEDILNFPDFFKVVCGSACKGIYSKKLIDENNIRFPLGIKLSEDKIFNFYFLSRVKRFYYTDKYFYHYFNNCISSVRKYRNKMLEEIFLAKQKEDEWIDNLNKNREIYRNIYNNMFIYVLMSCLMNEFKSDNKISLLKKYNNVKSILNNFNTISFIKRFKFKSIHSRKDKLKYILIKYKLAVIITFIGEFKLFYLNIKN